jgi:hypothetical protein
MLLTFALMAVQLQLSQLAATPVAGKALAARCWRAVAMLLPVAPAAAATAVQQQQACCKNRSDSRCLVTCGAVTKAITLLIFNQ